MALELAEKLPSVPHVQKSRRVAGAWLAIRDHQAEVIVLDDTHLLYIYDRIPNGWKAIAADSPETNSVWVVRVTLERG